LACALISSGIRGAGFHGSFSQWSVMCLALSFPLGWLLYARTFAITLTETTLTVIHTCSFSRAIRLGPRQDIPLSEISYIYHLEEELNVLVALRKHLSRWKIPESEMDYRVDRLSDAYGIPHDVFEAFEHDAQKALSEDILAPVLVVLDDLYVRYRIPADLRRKLNEGLQHPGQCTFDYAAMVLQPYAIRPQDLENLKEEFARDHPRVIAPFLVTKVNFGAYRRMQQRRGAAVAVAGLANTLVLSNRDGTQKVYIRLFHQLARKEWGRLIEYLNQKNPQITYVMTKQEYRALTSAR